MGTATESTLSPAEMMDFLASRNALLVHFNTPISSHPRGYPSDLQQAFQLRGAPISFSTISPGDAGAFQAELMRRPANAGGSVGLAVRLEDHAEVVSVGPGDDGTRFYSGGERQTGGSPPTAASCERSLDERATANEWWLQDYTPVGIFVFLPARTWIRWSPEPGDSGEKDVTLAEILADFPEQRIFSIQPDQPSFLEFDRSRERWATVDLATIVSP